MQIEKQLSHGCSPALSGLTSSVPFNAAHVCSAPALRLAWCGGQGVHALCPQWVYKTCWADKFNHRNHLRTMQPSICLSSKSWETDEVVEEAIEETAPCMLVGQRDRTCPMNGYGVDGQEGERGWSKHPAGPSHLLSSAYTLPLPFPFGWWGSPIS